MSYFVELNLPAYNAGEEMFNSYSEDVCVCCLAQNVPYVNLANCKHTEYLKLFHKYKIEFPKTVCFICHEMLKKIDSFKRQVEDVALILNKEAIHLKVRNMHNLRSTPLDIMVDISPETNVDTEIKEESEPDMDTETLLPKETDVKEESDTDMETEMPLSVIKQQKDTNTLVKKEAKRLRIKKELLDPSPFMDEKYVGKLKMHLLTREELEKEREMLKKEEKYQKLPFKCETCIIGFNREMYLNKHLKQRHMANIGSFTCEICKSVFNTEISLKPHQRRHFVRYDCKVCGRRYIDERAIVSHYNEKHGKDGATVQNKFKCKLEDCGFDTHSYRSFIYHRSKHERYPCTMCDKVYSKWIQLRSHIYGVHRKKQTSFPCKKCDKVYKQRCGLRIHMQSVHNTTDKLPYCAPCRMHFRTVHNLNKHLKRHSNHITDADKKYMCDNCGARFLTKSNLKGHVEWFHLKKSEFQCPQCLKVLRTAQLLKNHIAFVHEKKQLPRDKMCDYCGKGFTMRRCLQAHIRTHTGERPYQCPQCPAAFAHSASLYNHRKLVHNPHRQARNTHAIT